MRTYNCPDTSLFDPDSEAFAIYSPHIDHLVTQTRIPGFRKMTSNPQVIFKYPGTGLDLVYRILRSSDRHQDKLMVEKVIAAIGDANDRVRELFRVGGAILKGELPVLNGTKGMDPFRGVDTDRLFIDFPVNDRVILQNLGASLKADATGSTLIEPAFFMQGADQFLYTDDDSGALFLQETRGTGVKQTLPPALYMILENRLTADRLPPIIDAWQVTHIGLCDIARKNGHFYNPRVQYDSQL